MKFQPHPADPAILVNATAVASDPVAAAVVESAVRAFGRDPVRESLASRRREAIIAKMRACQQLKHGEIGCDEHDAVIAAADAELVAVRAAAK